MKLYTKLAEWWPLLSAPEEYEEEALNYKNILLDYGKSINTILELGSGGGNNAFHLKKHFSMTLVDISHHMLEVSKKINPECEHIQGNMVNVCLERVFDAVFIHDAIAYITTTADLQKVFKTAFAHLRAGGCLLITPDYFKETFNPSTAHGGHDCKERSLRYLEWITDPDPDDNQYNTDYVYMLRDSKGKIKVETDSAVCGLFYKNTWVELMEKAGFKVFIEPLNLSDFAPGTYYNLIGIKHETDEDKKHVLAL